MKVFKPLTEYQTSLIHVSMLENMSLFEISSEHQVLNDNAKARLVSRYEEDGSWTVYSKLEWGDEESVIADLSFGQMVETLIKAENVHFIDELYDDLDLEIFYPDRPQYIPIPEEMKLLNKYINNNKLNNSPDHICNLLYQIGEDKIAADKISEIVDKKQPHPISQKSVFGNKLFLN